MIEGAVTAEIAVLVDDRFIYAGVHTGRALMTEWSPRSSNRSSDTLATVAGGFSSVGHSWYNTFTNLF